MPSRVLSGHRSSTEETGWAPKGGISNRRRKGRNEISGLPGNPGRRGTGRRGLKWKLQRESRYSGSGLPSMFQEIWLSADSLCTREESINPVNSRLLFERKHCRFQTGSNQAKLFPRTQTSIFTHHRCWPNNRPLKLPAQSHCSHGSSVCCGRSHRRRTSWLGPTHTMFLAVLRGFSPQGQGCLLWLL